MRIIKRTVLILFILLLLLIIAWRVDRTFFNPYLPGRNEQIRSDVLDLKFTVPKDEAGCLAKGGVWKRIGIRPREECNLPTTDAGKTCTGTNQCEGVCLAELKYEDISEGMKGKLFRTNGKCSGFIKVVGCKGYVYMGWASVVCAD